MQDNKLYIIYALGDTAITIQLGYEIDENTHKKVMAAFLQMSVARIAGVIDLIPAYNTLTICYDVITIKKTCRSLQTAHHKIMEIVNEVLSMPADMPAISTRKIKIPVCYEAGFAVDIATVAKHNNLSIEDVVKLHTSKVYGVYMLGFLPGFAYMGTVDTKIATPRKEFPVQIKPGSVGIAGLQTGIYPLQSPGGWQIIGRSPLCFFDSEKDNPVLLQPGDEVSFYAITKNEFDEYKV